MQLSSIDILTLPAKVPADALTMGAPFHAVVQKSGDALQLRAQFMKIPLPENSGLTAGQNVMVRLTQTPEGILANVTVVPPEAPAATTEVHAQPAALGAAAIISGEASFTSHAATNARIVQMLGNLLATPGSGQGEQLQQIVSGLASVAVEGYQPEFSLEPLLIFARLISGESKEFERVVRMAASAAGSSLEARIAEAIASGDYERLREFIKTDLRSLLTRIKHDPKLTAELEKKGGLESLQKSAEGAIERLSAENLQNLRGMQQGYRFFEIPFVPAMGFNRAQFHVMYGGGGDDGPAGDGDAGVIAIDLSTTHLGGLWITLNVMGRNCSCKILARGESLEAIEDSREELIDALKRLRFTYAAVTVAPYDGRREREIMLLMNRFSALNLST
jgi:hypothetical protein